MPKVKGDNPSASVRRPRPGATPESRELQLTSYAVDLAEKQLLEGTASSQVITHFLKLATTTARLEREKLERENELLRAKTEALQAQKYHEEQYANVLNALRKYNGQGDEDDY